MSKSLKFDTAEFSVENLTRGLTLASRVCPAVGSSDRRRGLLGVKHLENGAGIWINPCEAVHTFGMQMVLDAFFLDTKLRVRKVSRGLRPWRIAVCFSATSVLEMKDGSAAITGTEAGDQLAFQALVPSPAASVSL